MKLRFTLLSILLAVWSAQGLRAEGNFYLKDGDRVVFYGDSITDQTLYTTFTETYVITRFPRMQDEFVHSGCGGDRVTRGGIRPNGQRAESGLLAVHTNLIEL